jgi:predicted dithiol-disulfide oxidoreductase (DUF899 family)
MTTFTTEDRQAAEKEDDMTWNLRLVSMGDQDFEEDPYVEIREVFYDTLGKPLGHTTATMSGEDTAEIRQYLMWALEALDKPVLTFQDDGKGS